jgi:hypothetical protein
MPFGSKHQITSAYSGALVIYLFSQLTDNFMSPSLCGIPWE